MRPKQTRHTAHQIIYPFKILSKNGYLLLKVETLQPLFSSILKKPETMDELQIARATAQILHRLEHWGKIVADHRPSEAGTGRFEGEELQLRKLKRMTYELAQSRAAADCRDFGAVLRETELGVMVEMGRILAETVDPVLEGLRRETVAEEGEVCGVCQEEMESGDEDVKSMGCAHRFHGFCIWRWLTERKSCPLCRNPLDPTVQYLKV